jgi:hypothetical protein
MSILAFPARPRAATPRRRALSYLDACRDAAGAALDIGDHVEALEHILDLMRHEPPRGVDRRAFDQDAADLAAALAARLSGRLALHASRLREGAR